MFALLFQYHQSTGRRLLPALRDITVHLRDFAGLALYPRLVIGRNIRSVTVKVKSTHEYDEEDWDEEISDGSDHPTQWDNAVAVLVPYASRLTRFEVTRLEFYRSSESMKDLYHSLRCLTVLKGALGMTHDVFQHLATLPCLESLGCTITSEELDQADFTGQADFFPCLSHLEIGINDLMAVSRFVQHISSRNLQTVLIREDSAASVWDLEMLFDALAVSKSCTDLKELRVLREEGKQNIPSFSHIGSEMLASLFPLSQLTVLEITIKLSVALDDEDLQNIVTAWPNLHTLCLGKMPMPPIPPRVTLEGLLHLTSRLPLKEVGLSVDCTKVLNYAETGSITPCPTLLSLSLYGSPILENIDHIIAPFTLAFPSLSRLRFGGIHGYYRWKAVERILEPIMEENRSRE